MGRQTANPSQSFICTKWKSRGREKKQIISDAMKRFQYFSFPHWAPAACITVVILLWSQSRCRCRYNQESNCERRKKIHRKNNNFKQTWNRIEWAKWKGKKKRWNINELHDGSLEHFLIHFQFNLRTRDAIGADTRWQCSGTRKLLMLMEIKIHKVRHMWFSYVLRYFAFLLSVSLSLSQTLHIFPSLYGCLSLISARDASGRRRQRRCGGSKSYRFAFTKHYTLVRRSTIFHLERGIRNGPTLLPPPPPSLACHRWDMRSHPSSPCSRCLLWRNVYNVFSICISSITRILRCCRWTCCAEHKPF